MNDDCLEDGYEMLRALYDFRSTTQYAKSLSFRVDDLFIVYEMSTKKRQWWEVVNCRGDVGYVPSNYVTTVEVTLKYLIQFLDGCITEIEIELARNGGNMTPERERLLVVLYEKKRKAEILCENGAKRRAHLAAEKHKASTAAASQGHGDGDAKAGVSSHSGRKETSPSMVVTKKVSKQMQHVRVSLSEIFHPRSKELAHANAQKKALPNVEVKEATNENHVQDTLHSSSNSNGPVQNNVDHDTPATSSQEQVQMVPNNTSINHMASSAKVDGTTSHKAPGMEIAYNLVEQVRHHTKLSHDMSQVGVAVVVSCLRDMLATNVDPLQCLDAILTHCQGRLEAPRHLVEDTYDGARLHIIFTELTSCKDDSQQRSWILHEDEDAIIEYINELTDILTNADPCVSRHMMSLDHYNAVNALIQYYQMEVRWTIRKLLLRSFGAMCHLDATVVTMMLNSVLPMELARDMQTNNTDVPRLLFSTILLIMLFSIGEAMPVAHKELLGLEFATFLFQSVETPPESDVDDQIPDKFIHLILAYNLQFSDPQDNYMLQALEGQANAKTFTEKILVLFVREDDPVRIFEHTPVRPNSVLKLFLDLFSRPKTAMLFYTNDVKVLIDNITRQLADLSPGDKRRKEYLLMCQLVMRNSPYQEHQHRCDDIRQCFTRIFCEEAEDSVEDQRLVRAISNEFPQYFKRPTLRHQ